jgi:hypothetical protein
MGVRPQSTEETLQDFRPALCCCTLFSNNEDQDRSRVGLAQDSRVKIDSYFTEDTKKHVSRPSKGFQERNLVIIQENG